MRFRAAILAILVVVPSCPIKAAAAAYVWPISNTTVPDAMNTSFGPRNNYSKWDMHDGVDLPGVLGTDLYAVASATVFLAGPAGTDGSSSRHVVLKILDPVDGVLYVPYFHLASIDPLAIPGAVLAQGQKIGTLGDDDATYAHLHLEFRRGSGYQVDSVHPLHYLPFTGTANFSAPVADRFTAPRALAARLLFGAGSKEEGDLSRVEVDLMNGASVLATRIVDFDDKTTIKEGNGDEFEFTNDIAVEGYQSSNMGLAGRTDLQYGILVRNLPPNCDGLVARVKDLAGNTKTSASVPVPAHGASGATAWCDDGTLPPAGWNTLISADGTGTTLWLDAGAVRGGTGGLVCRDESTTESVSQRACLERALPAGRFQWTAEGAFNLKSLDLPEGEDLFPLYFHKGAQLSVAARVRKVSGVLLAGISAKNSDGTFAGANSAVTVALNTWRRWRLKVTRIGTRETVAVLYLDGTEAVRIGWDTVTREPEYFRAGIGYGAIGARAALWADDIAVTEQDDPPTPPPAPAAPTSSTPASSTNPATPAFGSSPSSVRIFPGVSKAGEPVGFTLLPPAARIDIFDSAGRRINQYGTADTSSGSFTWRLEDSHGRRVPSGVYVALIRDPHGGRAVRKVAVVR